MKRLLASSLAALAVTIAFAQSEITAEWVDTLPITPPPPPATCGCIIASFPARAPYVGSGFPPPLPAGSRVAFNNACGLPLQMFQIVDTIGTSLPIPVGDLAPGRRYSLTPLQVGHTVVADLTGVVNGGAVAMGCPSAYNRPNGFVWGPVQSR